MARKGEASGIRCVGSPVMPFPDASPLHKQGIAAAAVGVGAVAAGGRLGAGAPRAAVFQVGVTADHTTQHGIGLEAIILVVEQTGAIEVITSIEIAPHAAVTGATAT